MARYQLCFGATHSGELILTGGDAAGAARAGDDGAGDDGAAAGARQQQGAGGGQEVRCRCSVHGAVLTVAQQAPHDASRPPPTRTLKVTQLARVDRDRPDDDLALRLHCLEGASQAAEPATFRVEAPPGGDRRAAARQAAVGLRRETRGSQIGGKMGTTWDSRDVGKNGHPPTASRCDLYL